MSVRAEWHLAAVVREEPDPFGKVVYSTGLSINLDGDVEELAGEWVRLGYIEGRMAGNGISCELKNNGQDCLTCPVATLDAAEPRSRLCRLGKDQGTLEQLCDARQAERNGPLLEIAELAGEHAELAAMPDELAELLTSVGL